jgi:hypothetical protein
MDFKVRTGPSLSNKDKTTIMVFDPLSVIGYVSTAAGLVSFLTTTVTRLEKQGRDFQDSGKQLRWYNTKFATSYLVLKAWQRLWCHGARTYSDDEYEYFWGAENFKEMREKINLIKIEMDDIGRLLYSGFEPESTRVREETEPTGEDWEGWQQRLKYLGGLQKRFNPKPSWVSKICFASFGGANLEERTKRLKEKVDDLKEFSTTAYWYAQTLDAQAVTEDELVRLLDRKRWIDELSKSLTELYQECGVNDTWSLVLGAPDEEGCLSSVDDQTDIMIEFDMFRMSQAEPNYKSIGILPLRCSQLR